MIGRSSQSYTILSTDPSFHRKSPTESTALLPTKSFEQELSKVEPGLLGPRDGTTVAERVRSSPFKEGSEPLLFPFLVLEAKSGTSRDGFHNCQIQTAFPIYALLKLQEDLKSQANASELGAVPLVWFFANRAEEWRVYGCFVSNDGTPEYVRLRLNSRPKCPKAYVNSAYNATLGWLYLGQR
jgi:hypothetical protein